MSELETSLAAYLRGEVDLEALLRVLGRCLAEAPERAPEARRLLDGALARGLTPGAHSALLLRLEESTPPRERAADATEHSGAFDTGFWLRERGRSGATTGRGTDTTRDPDRRGVTTTGSFPAGEDGREFGAGDRLRNRFELLSKLGEGGMGAVWKGKDLLKEEAKDRNPYVAIKLLQKNFKEHPDAFIALQRETAKQQRLAHPNVATVFSFDRDADSGAVFMTMDLLEGESLDHFIHDMPPGGLPEEEAMSIIKQLAAGLAYAHKNGLVHSDLKPGNCFLTRDGTVKLLDFGIARASKTKLDAEGVTTLFDPGELGAITPAYATIEMFEGMPPDPRDDIYA
ncbi:MAG: serine/threonine-protein kinase, partial [Gammaproteobacteria bacterium]|nr:serine/threonine-protein kinase [Gammaproteobacteria bacterium]